MFALALLLVSVLSIYAPHDLPVSVSFDFNYAHVS